MYYMKLFRVREFLPILALGIVLFILGAIGDKNVSEALYSNANLWRFGVIFSNFCLLPFFIVLMTSILVCAVVLYEKNSPYKKWVKIVMAIVLIIGTGVALYQCYDKIKDISDVIGRVGGIILAIVSTLFVLGISIYIALKLYYKYDRRKLFAYAFAALIIILASTLLMGGIKYLWSRPRPWYVFGYLDIPAHLDEFRAVYQPQPFMAFKSKIGADYFKSFPSNHTATTVVVLPALLLYSNLNPRLRNERARLCIIGCVLVFSLIVGLTRMIAGAHFLTDISFGFTCAFAVSLVGLIIANKVFKKYNLEENIEE